MALTRIEFFTKLADPNFAENRNIGADKKGLFTAARGNGGRLLGRAAERTKEIEMGARKLAELTGEPDAFKGLSSEQLTNISTNLKTLRDRMVKKIPFQRHMIVFKDMEAAISNAEDANSSSTKINSLLPSVSTLLTCGAVVLYTAAVLTGHINPPII